MVFENMDYTEPGDGSIVEGIGNEVLVAFVIGCITLLLALGWYSTNLTNSQTRLTTVRVHRRGVTLNRLPGSSTNESRSVRQAATANPPPEPQRNTPEPSVSGTINTAEVVVDAHVEVLAAGTTPPSDNAGLVPDVVSEDLLPDDIVEAANAHSESATAETDERPEISNISTRNDTDSPISTVRDTDSPISTRSDNDTAISQSEAARPRSDNDTPISELETARPGSDNDTPISESETERPTAETGHLAQQAESSEEQTEPLTTSTMSQESSPTGNMTEDEQTIQIRLKFLNDNDRLVRAKKSDTVGSFKRCHFATELSNNKLVRLIFNGQVLQDDKTLQFYNIADNTAIHALISESAAPSTTGPTQSDPVVFNAGALMVPLFAIILSLLWYLRYEYADLFNITSTFSLGSITMVFILCLVAQSRPTPPPANRRRQYGVTIGVPNRNN